PMHPFWLEDTVDVPRRVGHALARRAAGRRGGLHQAGLRAAFGEAEAGIDPDHLGEGDGTMSKSPSLGRESLSESLGRLVDQVCNRFEAACKDGSRPRIEDFLGDDSEPACLALLRELVVLEAHYRRARGEECRVEDYQARFPQLDRDWLAEQVPA